MTAPNSERDLILSVEFARLTLSVCARRLWSLRLDGFLNYSWVILMFVCARAWGFWFLLYVFFEGETVLEIPVV